MIREDLARQLHKDLVGPDAVDEVLSDRPSDVYLTGIIWPQRTRLGGEDDDRLAVGEDPESGEEASDTGAVASVRTMRPSVAGLSFAVWGEPPTVEVDVKFAHYELEENEDEEEVWRRIPVDPSPISVDCNSPSQRIPLEHGPEGIALFVRSVRGPTAGSRIVTVTLVNGAEGRTRRETEEATLFQTELKVRAGAGSKLIPRRSTLAVLDNDDRSNDLLYREAHEFAVGHTCGADWKDDGDGSASEVLTSWLPETVVPDTSKFGHEVFTELKTGELRSLDASWLSEVDDGVLKKALERIPEVYRKWITLQESKLEGLSSERRRTAEQHLKTCLDVAERMEDGARQIGDDPDLASAFRLANAAMNLQFRWAQLRQGFAEEKLKPLEWRPFQIGFILLGAASTVNAAHSDRGTMDLLWFPTGGGKTEAYLGLIAFLANARRLRFGDDGAGVNVVMRYTLRLLTTQQFTRAAAMILACEAIRRGRVTVRDDITSLGNVPFSIGLWVGNDATPNRIADACSALDNNAPSTPRQIEKCPACSSTLRWSCYRANGKPQAIHVRCVDTGCELHHEKLPLPVWPVDDDVYREKPTLLIGTVDKFAQIARRPEVGPLFNVGGANPPDLIIQDELHLISGALGTLVGLYECAVDVLMSRGEIRPKIIGSTATIRRASQQVGDLFDRETCQFPPPGLDADDSGFAVTDREAPGRRFVGVTTAGTSAKFTLQAVSASLLQAASELGSSDEEKNPYWTLVGYFNALRELGGALVLMQDDVPRAMELYARRHGTTARSISPAAELTSRLSQAEVRDMLDDMACDVSSGDALDTILATNMISVGVDVPRLGLMVVNGQPKGIAEYIQATSRVGRQSPGLVVTVLNNAKARDRSHYETFRTWHSVLYRDVETTSVTPFAPRARDRALHAPLAALARHLEADISSSPRDIAKVSTAVEGLAQIIADRAKRIDPEETTVLAELRSFLQEWSARKPGHWWTDKSTDSLLMSAEKAATLGRAPGRGTPRSTPNSVRNVEPGVPFRLAEFLAPPTSAGADSDG